MAQRIAERDWRVLAFFYINAICRETNPNIHHFDYRSCSTSAMNDSFVLGIVYKPISISLLSAAGKQKTQSPRGL